MKMMMEGDLRALLEEAWRRGYAKGREDLPMPADTQKVVQEAEERRQRDVDGLMETV